MKSGSSSENTDFPGKYPKINTKGTTMKERVIFTWSGGKDSTMALYELLKTQRYEVVSLITTVTQGYERISMHGVRISLLEQQAGAIGIPVDKIYISKTSSNEEYEAAMKDRLTDYKSQGIKTVVFGDIFLEDLRKYREDNLAKVGMKGLFPIWKRDTTELANSFIGLGFKSVIACVDTQVLDKGFSGRLYNRQFLSDLPAHIDPCGENGEFHSFTYGGPLFKKEIPFTKGECVLRDGRFFYCDLIP